MKSLSNLQTTKPAKNSCPTARKAWMAMKKMKSRNPFRVKRFSNLTFRLTLNKIRISRNASLYCPSSYRQLLSAFTQSLKCTSTTFSNGTTRYFPSYNLSPFQKQSSRDFAKNIATYSLNQETCVGDSLVLIACSRSFWRELFFAWTTLQIP
jgi:hypothetical protein